jgi:L-aspartate semialdehyde sulfurtransferase
MWIGCFSLGKAAFLFSADRTLYPLREVVQMLKTVAEINTRIQKGEVVVMTAEEVVHLARTQGVAATARQVDVVTTGTFSPMCSSGAFLNFGHADPPIRMTKVSVNKVPAYAGIAAVDAYLGATEVARDNAGYGGAHAICDLIAGQEVALEASSPGTDCYPRRRVRRKIRLTDMQDAFLFNPRNAYQNYGAAVNTSDRTLYTYMGVLKPRMGNIHYATSGELSPLLNDPQLRTIGIGTRLFLAGAVGYAVGAGTQARFDKPVNEWGIPTAPGATLAVTGPMRDMDPRYIAPAVMTGYGVSLFVGIGIPIPVLDEDLMHQLAAGNDAIRTHVTDYSVPALSRPVLGSFTYAQLRSGRVEIAGQVIPTAPLSSLAKAREIATVLKEWIQEGRFFLSEPVAPLQTVGNRAVWQGKELAGQ